MKYILALLSLLFLFSCSTEYKTIKDLKHYELNGKINHVSLYHYKAYEENGKIIRGEKNLKGEQDQTLTFNKSGYISQVYYYGESDSLDSKLVRELDKNNKCLKEIRYDVNENIIGESILTYDERGREIKRGKTLNNGTLYNFSFLHYNDKDLLISRKDFIYFDSQLYDSLEWVYDSKNRQIQENRYGFYGKQSENILEYSKGSSFPHKIYIYNKNNELSNIIEAEYNKNEHMIRATQFNSDTTLVAEIKLEYEYDKKGNWIKKTRFFDASVRSITVRKIIYF